MLEPAAVFAPHTDPGHDLVEAAVRAFQAGHDRELAFRRVVDAYYRPLRGYFARRVANADDGLELTQEAFLRIYQGLDGFRHEASFRTWAFRIAHTTYLRWLESRRRVVQESEIGDEDDPPVEAVDTATPLEGYLQKEASARLADAVETLPEQEKRCVTLRVYHDLSHREIADFLGLQVGTVKAHLNHARQKLRTRLAGDYGTIEL